MLKKIADWWNKTDDIEVKLDGTTLYNSQISYEPTMTEEENQDQSHPNTMTLEYLREIDRLIVPPVSYMKNIEVLDREDTEYVIFGVKDSDIPAEAIIEKLGFETARRWNSTYYRFYNMHQTKNTWACKLWDIKEVQKREKDNPQKEFVDRILPVVIDAVSKKYTKESYALILKSYEKPLSTTIDIIKDSLDQLGDISEPILIKLKELVKKIIDDIAAEEKRIYQDEQKKREEIASKLEERMNIEMEYVNAFVSPSEEESE